MTKFVIALCWFGLVMTPFIYHVSLKITIVEPTAELIEFDEQKFCRVKAGDRAAAEILANVGAIPTSTAKY